MLKTLPTITIATATEGAPTTEDDGGAATPPPSLDLLGQPTHPQLSDQQLARAHVHPSQAQTPLGTKPNNYPPSYETLCGVEDDDHIAPRPLSAATASASSVLLFSSRSSTPTPTPTVTSTSKLFRKRCSSTLSLSQSWSKSLSLSLTKSLTRSRSFPFLTKNTAASATTTSSLGMTNEKPRPLLTRSLSPTAAIALTRASYIATTTAEDATPAPSSPLISPSSTCSNSDVDSGSGKKGSGKKAKSRKRRKNKRRSETRLQEHGPPDGSTRNSISNCRWNNNNNNVLTKTQFESQSQNQRAGDSPEIAPPLANNVPGPRAPSPPLPSPWYPSRSRALPQLQGHQNSDHKELDGTLPEGSSSARANSPLSTVCTSSTERHDDSSSLVAAAVSFASAASSLSSKSRVVADAQSVHHHSPSSSSSPSPSPSSQNTATTTTTKSKARSLRSFSISSPFSFSLSAAFPRRRQHSSNSTFNTSTYTNTTSSSSPSPSDIPPPAAPVVVVATPIPRPVSTPAASAPVASSPSPSSIALKDLQQHYPLARHQRQHSHPQAQSTSTQQPQQQKSRLSNFAGPTTTTLAQSPPRHRATSALLPPQPSLSSLSPRQHRLQPSSSTSFTSSTSSSSSPSPPSSSSPPPAPAASTLNRYHSSGSSSSNNNTTTSNIPINSIVNNNTVRRQNSSSSFRSRALTDPTTTLPPLPHSLTLSNPGLSLPHSEKEHDPPLQPRHRRFSTGQSTVVQGLSIQAHQQQQQQQQTQDQQQTTAAEPPSPLTSCAPLTGMVAATASVMGHPSFLDNASVHPHQQLQANQQQQQLQYQHQQYQHKRRESSNSNHRVVWTTTSSPGCSSGEGSSVASESSVFLGSRRSSKDSCDSSTPGTTIEELMDQLVIPDYENPGDQVARTNTFLLIFRRFMRPGELLKMFIDRFEDLGDYVDEEDLEANNTRLRICSCLYIWLMNHPNDLIHRQTRQNLASFLKERVAQFPCLNKIYSQLKPLSTVQYFYTWRRLRLSPGWDTASARTSWASASTMSYVSEDETDSGYYDASSNCSMTEEEMDEDREWGYADEDVPVLENSSHHNNYKRDSQLLLSPFSQVDLGHRATAAAAVHHHGKPHMFGGSTSPQLQQLHYLAPRDRRSSTGSFVLPLTGVSSPCEMGSFVAGRRGSASSVSSNPAAAAVAAAAASIISPLSPDDQAPFQLHQLQPMTPIPIINKRSSSQAYRHQRTILASQQSAISSTADSPTLEPSSLDSTANLQMTSEGLGRQRQSTEVTSEEKIHPFCAFDSVQSSPQLQPQQLSKPPKQRLQFDPEQSKLASTIVHQSMLSPASSPGSVKGPSKSVPPTSSITPAKVLIDPLNVLHPHLSTQISFMDLKDSAIADQLTWMEVQLFQKLQPRDMLRQVWKGKRVNGPSSSTGSRSGTHSGSVTFQACIAHFNHVSSWVSTMILLPQKAKNRAKMMEKFISIARILKDMQNFSTLMAIVSAMNSAAIYRLHQTRHLVANGSGSGRGHSSNGSESWKAFQELEQLMSTERSYSEYRATLKTAAANMPMASSSSSSSQPLQLSCIPHLGIHLADLFLISEGNKDFRQDGTLHWQKFVLMTDTIASVMQFLPEKQLLSQQQQSGESRSGGTSSTAGYGRIQSDPFISRFISDIHVMDEDERFKRSVELEPPVSQQGSSSQSSSSNPFSSFSSPFAATHHSGGTGSILSSSSSVISSTSSKLSHSRSLSKFAFFG